MYYKSIPSNLEELFVSSQHLIIKQPFLRRSWHDLSQPRTTCGHEAFHAMISSAQFTADDSHDSNARTIQLWSAVPHFMEFFLQRPSEQNLYSIPGWIIRRIDCCLRRTSSVVMFTNERHGRKWWGCVLNERELLPLDFLSWCFFMARGFFAAPSLDGRRAKPQPFLYLLFACARVMKCYKFAHIMNQNFWL
jgi:hypothetical protein